MPPIDCDRLTTFLADYEELEWLRLASSKGSGWSRKKEDAVQRFRERLAELERTYAYNVIVVGEGVYRILGIDSLSQRITDARKLNKRIIDYNDKYPGNLGRYQTHQKHMAEMTALVGDPDQTGDWTTLFERLQALIIRADEA